MDQPEKTFVVHSWNELRNLDYLSMEIGDKVILKDAVLFPNDKPHDFVWVKIGGHKKIAIMGSVKEESENA